jgi:hypothetical protein
MVRPRPGSSTGTVVSSPWIFSAIKTCARIAETIGSSNQAALRRQSIGLISTENCAGVT